MHRNPRTSNGKGLVVQHPITSSPFHENKSLCIFLSEATFETPGLQSYVTLGLDLFWASVGYWLLKRKEKKKKNIEKGSLCPVLTPTYRITGASSPSSAFPQSGSLTLNFKVFEASCPQPPETQAPWRPLFRGLSVILWLSR